MLETGPDTMQRTVTIEREELNGVHEFVLRIDGERYGFLEFTRPEVGVMRIEYVEVSPELRGTGLRPAAGRKGGGLREGSQPSSRSDLFVRSRGDPARSGAERRDALVNNIPVYR